MLLQNPRFSEVWWKIICICPDNYCDFNSELLRKEAQGKKKKRQIDCFSKILQVTYKNRKIGLYFIQEKATISVNTQFAGS